MIKSVNQVSINVLEPSQLDYVYINSVLDIRGGEYISETKHFYEVSGSQNIIHIGVEKYSHEQTNFSKIVLNPSLAQAQQIYQENKNIADNPQLVYI
jgi:hypothetical protein